MVQRSRSREGVVKENEAILTAWKINGNISPVHRKQREIEIRDRDRQR